MSQYTVDFASHYRDSLLMDVIPFWLNHAIDSKDGGIFTSLDRSGRIYDTDKSVWAQGRSAWMLLEMFNEPMLVDHEDRSQWLEAATSIIKFLDDFCIDTQDGRMWFHVTADGRPLRKRRYGFTEAFAAIAFGEMAAATGSEKWKTKAIDRFNGFCRQSNEPSGEPKFTTVRPSSSIGVPMIGLITAQELRSVVNSPMINGAIDQFIGEIESKFWKPDLGCVMETVSPKGDLIDHVDGWTLNPGHAIEAAWFILEEGKVRQRTDWVTLGCEMLKAMFERGWDARYGGLLYFVGLDDKRPPQEYWHDMKFWWNHAELVNASLQAYLLTGRAEFQAMHLKAHEWTFDHFPDPSHGEWFGYLRRDGSVSNECKGNLWKGPFHIPRMLLNCWRMLATTPSKAESSQPEA